MATLTTTPNVTFAAWRRGDYRRHHHWRGDVLLPVVMSGAWFFWSMAALVFTWFCMLHSGLMILEANL